MATRPSEELVIDRTLSDVNLERDKGHYNIEDLNRVREWSIYIRDLLNENGYYVSITPDDEWEMETMPYQSKVDKVKSDVMTLKNAYYTLQEYDLHIGQKTMSYTTANDIEKY